MSRTVLTLIAILFSLSVRAAVAQNSKKPVHSWDAMMNSPEAKDAAAKLMNVL